MISKYPPLSINAVMYANRSVHVAPVLLQHPHLRSTCALHQCTFHCEPLSHEQQKTLQDLLTVYMDWQCSCSDKLLFVKEIASGIPTRVILALSKNAHVINSPEYIADASISSSAA